MMILGWIQMGQEIEDEEVEQEEAGVQGEAEEVQEVGEESLEDAEVKQRVGAKVMVQEVVTHLNEHQQNANQRY